MPATVDIIEPHRQAVAYFGAVIHRDGTPAPSVNTGLLTSATAFQVQTGIPVASGTHVLSIEASLLGDVALEERILVDGAPYINHGPVDKGDLVVRHLQVVPERV